MKIRTSIVTAQILKEHCGISNELLEQINEFTPKSDTVYLFTSQKEMEVARDNLQKYMSLHKGFHLGTFEHTFKELVYFASSGT